MNKTTILSILSVLIVSCTSRWIAIPQNVPDFKRCTTLSVGPHMVKVPGFEKSYIVVDTCEVMDAERVSIAMHVFLQKWKESYPHRHLENKKVEKAIGSLMTEFNNKKKSANAYTVDGLYGTNLSLSGLTLTPGWIWVKTIPGERLCQTSFVHELVHVAIWNLKGTNGDPDHLGPKYRGWNIKHNIIIQETNALLCELGI